MLQVTGNIYYQVPQLFPKQKQAVYTTLRSLFKALHSKGAFFTLFLNTVGGCDCCALLKAKGFRGSYIVNILYFAHCMESKLENVFPEVDDSLQACGYGSFHTFSKSWSCEDRCCGQPAPR